MKKTALILLAGALLSGFTGPERASAQQRPMVGCIDPAIRSQADEIKQHFISQGFTVYRDGMLNMESMTPVPVMVQLDKGQLYQIIFVGHQASGRIGMELFDGNDKKMDARTLKRKGEEPNYLVYTLAPRQTDTYLLTFMQQLKHEQVCGSLCILKMDSGKKAAADIRPYHP